MHGPAEPCPAGGWIPYNSSPSRGEDINFLPPSLEGRGKGRVRLLKQIKALHAECAEF